MSPCCIILLIIPLKQGLSLTLEMGWRQYVSVIFLLLPPTLLGLQVCTWPCLALYMTAGDLDPGPDAFTVNIFTHEPSPYHLPPSCFLQ